MIALDIESLDPARDMSLANARRFIQRIKKKTGRYPMLYANQAVVKEISRTYPRDKIFSNTALWYARFKSRVTDFPTKPWDAYTLWQFSSEINCSLDDPENCLYRVPGTQTDMDVNVYRGTVEELRSNWPFTAVGSRQQQSAVGRSRQKAVGRKIKIGPSCLLLSADWYCRLPSADRRLPTVTAYCY